MIRTMSPDDLPGVAAILNSIDLFPADMLPDMAAPGLAGNEGEVWFVATDADRITAFAYCRAEELTDRTWNILALGVAAADQGAGWGRAMLDHIARQMRATNQRLLIVETADIAEFAPQRAFYTANGYLQVAHIPEFYDAGTGKITFLKRLTPEPA